MSNEKIIIETNDVCLKEALGRVAYVIDKGRISDSGRSFCSVTNWGDGTVVFCRRNKTSDKFLVEAGLSE